MLAMGSIDWTTVIVAGISAIGSLVTGVLVVLVRLAIRTPSGDPIGHVVERGHDLAAANLALLRKVNGVKEEEG